MSYSIEALAAELNGNIRGDGSALITGCATPDQATEQQLAFIANEQQFKKFSGTQAGVLLMTPELSQGSEMATNIIEVADPFAAFHQVLYLFYSEAPRKTIGVSDAAFVSPAAVIGEATNIFPGAYVAEDVRIGARCDIYPGVYIGPGCRIANDVKIYANAALHCNVILGDRVIIHPSAVLGSDGFGYRLAEGRHAKIPHYGFVRVEADAEIGACTTVDRAMIGDTVVGQGTKLDNLVQIAHNCRLGKHNIMVGQVGLAGSVTSGDYVVCAGHVGIADHVHLGTGCVLGSKAGVHKDIPAGETYIGTPAQPVKEAMKIVMAQRKVPEMRKEIKDLQQQVAQLTRQITEQSDPKTETRHVA